MLSDAEKVEYQALRLKVLEQSGKRKGLAKKDADPKDKVRLRELIAKCAKNLATTVVAAGPEPQTGL